MKGRVGGFFVLCLLVAALAGCTTPTPTAKETCAALQGCPTGEPQNGPLPPLGEVPLPFPNVTLPMLQLIDCRVQAFVLDVPQSSVRPYVPAAFELSTAIAPDTTLIVAWLHVCERTLDDRTVFGQANILWILSQVRPVNESWTDGNHYSNYMMTAAADIPGLVASLSNRSVEAENATFESFVSPDVSGNHLQHWKVKTEKNRAEFVMPLSQTDPEERKMEIFLWSGKGPYERAILSDSFRELAFLVPSTVIADGPGPLRGSMVVPALPSIGSNMEHYTMTLQFDSEWE